MDSPLVSLMAHLAHDRADTLAVTAAKLDISLDLLEQMLSDLQRGGYIQPVEAACGAHCEHCSQNQGCGLQFRGRLWAVTEKGFRLAGMR